MKAVKIVRDPETIKLLADLVRREILRLIAVEPLTQKQLAEKVGIAEPSMSHHLQLLRKAGLIKIKEAKVGSHGILEKYYEPAAKLFIEDWEKIPLDLRRYFVHSHMERLRGMISVFQLIAEEQGKSVEVTSKEIKELAQEIAKRIPEVAEKYENIETNMDRETLLIKIYSETLKIQMNKGEWKDFFSKIKNLLHKQTM
ncbi:MAG: winged helix-turn-helix domain-containing protein [Candidatus Bathyarchaeia archaeon]